MDKIISEILAGAVVLTATRQQAAQLRWQFGRHQATQGSQAWPAPRVHLLSAWVEQAWEQSLVHGGVGARRALLTRGQARWLWRQQVRLDVEPSAPLLHLVEQAWRLVNDWHINLPTIGRRATSFDHERFYAWASGFDQRCAEQGWIDSVAAMDQLGAEFAGGAPWIPERLLFVGFDSWHPALQELLVKLQAGGCRAEPLEATVANPTPPRRLEFADQLDEYQSAARWTARAAAADRAGAFAIVVPDPVADGPALRRAALDSLQADWRQRGGAQRPVTGGVQRKLADLGAVHAALLCLQLCAERMDYQALGQLLRSPYLAASRQDRAGRARLDAWLRERGERDWDLRVVARKAQDLAPEFANAVLAAGAARATGLRTPAEWRAWIQQLLRDVGWPGSEPVDADHVAAIQACRDLLDEFAGCGFVTGAVSFSAASSLLAEVARELPAPANQAGGGLQLLGVAEALGQQFDGLWIAGLHAEAWPPPMQPNSLVPLDLQRQAGVPAAAPASHARHAAWQLDQLWHAAGEVIVSSARRHGEERLTPAPRLLDMPAAEPSALLTPHPPSLTEAILATGETETVADPVPAMAPWETPRGGARLLQLQAVCPARAFFELRLHARELPVPSFGIDSATRGELVHAVLERLFNAMDARQLGPAAAEARTLAAEIVAQSLPRHLAMTPLNRVLLQLEARRLERLVGELLDFDAARPDFRLRSTESRLELSLAGLELNLRVDRIDELASGQTLIIDYKTGAKKRLADWFGDRPAEPQLPLYAVGSDARGVAYLRLGEDGVSADGVAALATDIPGIQPVAKVRRGEHEDWESLVQHWRASLEAVAAEFMAGSCAIDLEAPQLAAGQYAPLTRVFDAQAME